MTNNCCLPIADHDRLLDQAENIFDLVWRVDFSQPGFALIEIPPDIGSHVLRSWMVDLKLRLSDIGMARGRGPLAYKSMGRFDQQETTKFISTAHRSSRS